MSASKDSVTITGLKELRAQGVVSSGSYTARLVGWSDEEAAVCAFGSLVEAIRWLTEAVENGALIKQANVYSANSELIWSIPGSPREHLREIAMKRNAERIFAQSSGQEHPLEILGGEFPVVPDSSEQV
jgi:hypothetical protein